MGRRCTVSVRFHEPPADLKRFFTTFYRLELDCPDGPVEDALQPEWAGFRFLDGPVLDARLTTGETLVGTDFGFNGPTSVPIHLRLSTMSMWGIGLLPLGWATFMNMPAHTMANRILNCRRDPAFAQFAALADRLLFKPEHEQDDLAAFAHFFREEAPRNAEVDDRITLVHQLLVEADLPDVSGMAERAGLHPRTLERLCRKSFGFAPKKLLRRQRFMRSLASFMLDPSMKWIGAMDALYFDQSHFVRDCKEFLGMSPSEYAALDHRILSVVMRERMAARGAAAQTLDQPG